MPEARPAPVLTFISAPSPASFFTVSGVAATRVSAASVSAGTAISMEAPINRRLSRNARHLAFSGNRRKYAALGIIHIGRIIGDGMCPGHVVLSQPSTPPPRLAETAPWGKGSSGHYLRLDDFAPRRSRYSLHRSMLLMHASDECGSWVVRLDLRIIAIAALCRHAQVGALT